MNTSRITTRVEVWFVVLVLLACAAVVLPFIFVFGWL